MEYAAKINLMSWWITITIAILLWYRNYSIDRLFTGFIIILAVIELLEYAKKSYTSTSQIIYLQVVALFVMNALLSISALSIYNSNYFWVLAIYNFIIMVLIIFWSSHIQQLLYLFTLNLAIIIVMLLITIRTVPMIIVSLYIVMGLILAYYNNDTLTYVIVGFAFMMWLLGIGQK